MNVLDISQLIGEATDLDKKTDFSEYGLKVNGKTQAGDILAYYI